MTWEDLAKMIAELPEEQRRTDVTVHLRRHGEFFGAINGLQKADERDTDVLDPGHPYLEI